MVKKRVVTSHLVHRFSSPSETPVSVAVCRMGNVFKPIPRQANGAVQKGIYKIPIMTLRCDPESSLFSNPDVAPSNPMLVV